MTNNQVNGRTFQDIKRDFQASQEFGRVIETPVVKSEVKTVKNNDAQVKRYMSNLRAQRTIGCVGGLCAVALTLLTGVAIVDDFLSSKDECDVSCPSSLDIGHSWSPTNPIRLY